MKQTHETEVCPRLITVEYILIQTESITITHRFALEQERPLLIYPDLFMISVYKIDIIACWGIQPSKLVEEEQTNEQEVCLQ